MKRIISIFLILLLAAFARANKIDSLYTKENVQKFLAANLTESGIIFPVYCIDISQAEKIRMYLAQPEEIPAQDPVTGEWVIVKISRIYDSNDNCCKDFPLVNYRLDEVVSRLHNDRYHFYKTDLDHNGYTDLVINAGIIIVVMDMGNRVDGYMFSEVSDAVGLVDIISLPDKSNALLLKYKHCAADTAAVDTIVYKFNAFVKYNPSYKPVGVRKINYYFRNTSAMACMERQNCMEINKDGRCFLKYRDYNTTFSASLGSTQVNELWNLIAYINVKSRKDVYSHWVDHGEGGTFTFYFDDGTVKKIEISSCPPPVSLGYLSKNIAGISRALKWQPAEARPDFECPCNHEGGDSTADCGCEW